MYSNIRTKDMINVVFPTKNTLIILNPAVVAVFLLNSILQRYSVTKQQYTNMSKERSTYTLENGIKHLNGQKFIE